MLYADRRLLCLFGVRRRLCAGARFGVNYAARTFLCAQSAVLAFVIIYYSMIINDVNSVKMTCFFAKLTANAAFFAVLVYISAYFGIGAEYPVAVASGDELNKIFRTCSDTRAACLAFVRINHSYAVDYAYRAETAYAYAVTKSETSAFAAL